MVNPIHQDPLQPGYLVYKLTPQVSPHSHTHSHHSLLARLGEYLTTRVPRTFSILLASCWLTIGLPASLLVSTLIPFLEECKNSYPSQPPLFNPP